MTFQHSAPENFLVELATLGWVHWHNTARLHGYLNDVPPAEFEAKWREANTRATLSTPQSAARTPGVTNHPTDPAAHTVGNQ